MSNLNSMLLISSDWNGMPTFRLIPITESCPFIECIFNIATCTLAIIGKNKKDTFHLVPKLDNSGKPIPLNNGEYEKQRIQQESYSEYYITEKDEIKKFIDLFAVNKEFDFNKYLNKPTMMNPGQSPTASSLIL